MNAAYSYIHEQVINALGSRSFFSGHILVPVVPNKVLVYQLHSTMKEIGSFVDLCTGKALLMEKRGSFVLVCPVEHLYLGINIHGRKLSL